MGTSKALLTHGDRTFVECTVAALREGGCEPVLVGLVDPLGPEAAAARRAGAELLAVHDSSPGPIASLRAAIAAHPSAPAVAVLPVDHPAVRPATVAALLAEHAASGAAIVVPEHEGRRGHPAVFDRSLFAELTDPALQGGARTVVRADPGRVRTVPVDDPGVLLDVDTPQDLARLAAQANGLAGQADAGSAAEDPPARDPKAR
ncbi:MAG: nucleotidyltransferase family protein [Gemmatimonadetes bacterium]|nr:MAG: nucleotidyltransferase family protein [Gemmatimonadota bacterium]